MKNPMNDCYGQLATALRARLAIIADRDAYSRDPNAHLNQLKAVSEQICALRERLPPPVDPQLAHYLDRASYDKALAFIDALLGEA
jgi:hypothetical protein